MAMAAYGRRAEAGAHMQAGTAVGGDALKGPYLDLRTGRGNQLAYARLQSDIDFGKQKYFWFKGYVMGHQPMKRIRDLVGAQGEPLFFRITRWESATPQYHIGHLNRVDEIEGRLQRLGAIAVAGSAYRGTGIPQCIRSGQQAAATVIRRHRRIRRSRRHRAVSYSIVTRKYALKRCEFISKRL